jgi:hypothetical protein
MRPKVLQDVFDALATVYPEGIISIVHLISQQPDGVPLYHINQALHLYRKWRERSGTTLTFSDLERGPMPFDQWIVRHCALRRWDDHFVPMMLSWLPDVAIDLVLGPFRTDKDKAAKVLGMLKGVRTCHAGLLEHMLSTPKLVPLVTDVFTACFDTFPVDGLQRCIASKHINQEMLLVRLAGGSNPLHLPVHGQLIRRIVQQPINLQSYKLLASALKSHTRHDVIELLRSTLTLSEDNSVWLVRDVELARGERLIDEAAHFRA